MDNTLLWIVFALAVIPLLALDLGLFQRKAHAVGLREAAVWSAVWVGVALLFGAGVFHYRGTEAGLQFLTGYVIEKSLSVDNVFLFAVIFAYFQVPSEYQRRVLLWGVLGAIVMRAVLIVVGAALIARFHWILYLFGALLLLTGVKMFLYRNRHASIEENGLVRWIKRHLHLTETYHGARFFTRIDGALYATPLFLALAMVEFTDLVFAVDSIPAIFAVTTDPFLVLTSNVFAILGLRALYFLLAGVMEKFRYLKVGLSGVLVFVGVKMLLPFKVNPALSLAVILTLLAVSVVASLLADGRQRREAQEPASDTYDIEQHSPGASLPPAG